MFRYPIYLCLMDDPSYQLRDPTLCDIFLHQTGSKKCESTVYFPVYAADYLPERAPNAMPKWKSKFTSELKTKFPCFRSGQEEWKVECQSEPLKIVQFFFDIPTHNTNIEISFLTDVEPVDNGTGQLECWVNKRNCTCTVQFQTNI